MIPRPPLALALALVVTLVAGLAAGAVIRSALDDDTGSLDALVTRLSYNTASGGGVNLKMMLDPESGERTVPLREVFGFDRNFAFCRIDTNPQAFTMQTFSLGEITVEPYQFFMSMEVTSVDQYEITADADGNLVVVMRGGLDCNTEVGQATTTIGSRTAAEHATYRITAVDGGIGGGAAGDRFEFTVFFDPDEAPVNYSIFGPEFTFTGEMVSGEITIVDPTR